MRNVVNISLPQIMVKEIKTTVQEGNLLAEIEQSRQESKAGQGKILHSLKDLR